MPSSRVSLTLGRALGLSAAEVELVVVEAEVSPCFPWPEAPVEAFTPGASDLGPLGIVEAEVSPCLPWPEEPVEAFTAGASGLGPVGGSFSLAPAD
jgi:hypothetical protein